MIRRASDLDYRRFENPPSDASRTAWALVGIGISFGLVFALVAAMKPQPQPATP